MIKKDYHIHSLISPDATSQPEKIIQKAINKNYSTIAITDHFEPAFPSWGFQTSMNYNRYHSILNELKQKYKNQIAFKIGIEIGEYYLKKSETLDFFAGLKPDIIIGSVHTAAGVGVSDPLYKKMNRAEIITYYKANLRMVDECDIDILGHLGIFNRYLLHDVSPGMPIIKDIFQTMKERGIALELNYSGLRKPLKQLIPDISVLEEYAKQGGKLITIGSDSHQISDFDDHYDEAYNTLFKINPDFQML